MSSEPASPGISGPVQGSPGGGCVSGIRALEAWEQALFSSFIIYYMYLAEQ